MAEIKYITGSALEPRGPEGDKLIAHICNDAGGWGSGFVVAISNKWKYPEEAYRNLGKDRVLGACQAVHVQPNIIVMNMIGQVGHDPSGKHIRYEAVEECLTKLAQYCHFIINEERMQCSIHMPRIGCGLAGGNWKEIEKIIQRTIIKSSLDVYIYTLEGDTSWR